MEEEKQKRRDSPMEHKSTIALMWSVPVSLLIMTVMMTEGDLRRSLAIESYRRSEAVIQGENWYATKIGEGILQVNGTARMYLWPNMPDTDLRTKQAREAVMEISRRCEVISTAPYGSKVLVTLREGTNCKP